jgi:hypothetical protein
MTNRSRLSSFRSSPLLVNIVKQSFRPILLVFAQIFLIAGVTGCAAHQVNFTRDPCRFDNSCDKEVTDYQIAAVFHHRLNRLQHCYDMESAVKEGSILTTLTLRSGGSVSSIRVDLDGMNDPELTQCVVKEVSGWSFPSAGARTGKPIPVAFNFPFLIGTSSECGVSLDTIRKAIDPYTEEIISCVPPEQQVPTEILLNMTLVPSTMLHTVDTLNDGDRTGRFRECLEQRFSRWKFPRQSTCMEMQFAYRIRLN